MRDSAREPGISTHPVLLVGLVRRAALFTERPGKVAIQIHAQRRAPPAVVPVPLQVAPAVRIQHGHQVDDKAVQQPVSVLGGRTGGSGIEAFGHRVRQQIEARPPAFLVVDERLNGGGDYTKTAKLIYNCTTCRPSVSPGVW